MALTYRPSRSSLSACSSASRKVAAPIGALRRAADVGHLASGAITLTVNGKNVTGKDSITINRLGVAYIPEERMIDGVIKDFTVAENYVLQDHGRQPFVRGGIFMRFGAITTAFRAS